MRPLFLHLQNIGPFKNQSIDFASLPDMFLVCGKTGAGKSTIFNAITYALYGKLSGSHSSVNGSQIRSDFASPAEEAAITFIFLLHDKRYKVRRELARTHITKNGTATQKPESLEVYLQKGEEFQLLSHKKSEAEKTLTTMMGLTVEEFSRIIILPQGEFAEFLRQNSTNRRETLLKLFPLDDYERLMEAIKTRKKEDSTKLELIESQLQSFGDFNLHQQEEILAQYRSILQHNQDQKRELTEKQTSTSMEIQSCSQQLDDFLSHEALSSKLALHIGREDTIQRQRQQISLAERAVPVHTRIQTHQKAALAQETARTQLDSTTATLQKLEEERSLLQQQEPAIQQLRESHGRNLILEQEVARGVETERELAHLERVQNAAHHKFTELQRRQESLAARKDSLEEELSQLHHVSIQNLEPLLHQQSQLASQEHDCTEHLANARERLALQERIEAQRQAMEKAREKACDLQQEFHRQQQQLETLREQNLAQILASSLRPGKPCPVCGSTSHHLPDGPVQTQTLNPIQQQPHQPQPKQGLLQQLQESVRQLEEQKNLAQQKSSREEGSLEQMLQQEAALPECLPIPQLESQQAGLQLQRNQLEAEITSLRQAIGRKEGLSKEREACHQQQEPLLQECNKVQQELASIAGQIGEKETLLQQTMEKAKTAGFLHPSVAETQQELDNWLKTAASSIRQFDQQMDSIRQTHSQETARLQERTVQLERCQQEAKEARNQMEDSLKAAGFATVAEAEAAYLSLEEIQGLRKALEAWQEELTRLKTQVTEIGKRLTGTREEAESRLHQLQAQTAEIQLQLATLEENYKTAFHQQEETKARIDRWKELEAQRQDAQQKASLSHQLYTHISDKNKKNLALTTWILGVYLDQIVACANGRLQRISEGRYTLRFTQEKGGNGAKGLDLEILDSYTGKSRPCATLSGGETFMVSISLALALTDVVSSKKGGISLQSLFIDEGFGSLDPASLDKAMSILEEIREGRCIGIISHVTEMQSRIPSRLEVLKTTTGSSVRIVEG